MAPAVALLDDLLFLSRIREAARASGVEVRAVRSPSDLLAACRPAPFVVFVDLDSPRIRSAEALAALRGDPELAAVPVVGFFSHVHAERARDAQAAGCTRVLPRSTFVKELPALLSLG